jgi:hypothetical protein
MSNYMVKLFYCYALGFEDQFRHFTSNAVSGLNYAYVGTGTVVRVTITTERA